jgi:hypothetical protein
MTEAIQNWLKKKIALHILGCWLGSVLALLAGVLILFLTFWLADVVLFVGQWGVSAFMELCFNRGFHISHFWRLIISGIFLAALFAEWFRRRNMEFGNYGKVRSFPGAQALVLYDGVAGALAMLLANPQASSTMITEILYTGPRLIMGAISLAHKARSPHFDTEGCSQILQQLASKERAVTYEELNTTKSEFEKTKLHDNLAQIRGIVFLEKGLGLTDDLREELSGLMFQG